MAQEEKQGDQPEAVEAIAPLQIPADARITLWGTVNSLVVPAGAILTLFHEVPVHGSPNEIVGFTPRPIAYYVLSGEQLTETATLLVRQAILWASGHGGEGAQGEVESAVLGAIEAGRTRAEAARRAGEEPEDQEI